MRFSNGSKVAVNMAIAPFGIMRDMIGLGTLINIGTIVTGSTLGVAIGSKLPERTNRVVTDALGLITLVMGGLNLASLGDAELVAAVGPAAPYAGRGAALTADADTASTFSAAALACRGADLRAPTSISITTGSPSRDSASF